MRHDNAWRSRAGDLRKLEVISLVGCLDDNRCQSCKSLAVNYILKSAGRMLHSVSQCNSGCVDDHTTYGAGQCYLLPALLGSSALIYIHKIVGDKINRIQCKRICKWLRDL